MLGRPVTELVRERLPVTLRSVGYGLMLGWAAGLLLSLQGIARQRPACDLILSTISGSFLSLPSAFSSSPVLLGLPPAIAMPRIFPRVFVFTYEQLQSGLGRPHVLAAHARGVRPWRVIFRYVLPPALPSIVAMFGVSISVAFGAAIPVEVVADRPGIGQLAWQAALGRDIQVLVSLTLMLAAIALMANSRTPK